MRHLVTLVATAALALCSGCASDTVRMSITSDPAGAQAMFRVVSADNPQNALTSWLQLGPTPFVADVAMPEGWGAPASLVEVSCERPGFRPARRIYEPAAILSSGRFLKDHLLLETDTSGPAR